jgi:putative transcription antitermination factor YqgF
MRYLGIDYGTKKVGLALSDEAGAMGFPHAVFTTTSTLADDLIELIKEREVGAIVIGESRNFSGAPNRVDEDVRKLADTLAGRTGLPIHFEPETYTTQEARRFPDGTRMPGSPDVDASAAALILTSFLEHHKPVAEVYSAPMAPTISIDDFSKVEVKVGTVVLAERVPETDKLLRLLIDVGEEEPRQIVSGIAAYVSEPETLVGRQLAFVTNLAPRKLRGLESNGMLFAVGEGDSFAFMVPDRPVPPGTAAH